MNTQIDQVPGAAQFPLAAGRLPGVASLAPLPEDAFTPAGLQDRRALWWRRLAVAFVNTATMGVLGLGIAMALSAGGWSVADLVILGCFLVGAPWTVMGFWNAVIGLWLLHGRRDGLDAVAPFLAAGDGAGPLTTRTALAMTVRNEPPARALARLAEMRRALDATGYGHHFDIHVLSDTNEPEVAEEEERLFHRMRGELGGARAFYRRRTVNTGYKAGNVREFLLERGRDYELYLPLDADSYMGAGAILRMVRIMEAYPRLGILQSLSTGMPSASLFTRALTFGARVATPRLPGGRELVAWRHRVLLGPQRADPHGAVPPALPSAGAAGPAAAGRAHPEPRPARGGADAARRMGVPRHPGRDRELGGEPADAGRFHPPRPALVQRQHAGDAAADHARA